MDCLTRCGKELEQKQADVAATLEELKVIHCQCLRYLTENAPCSQEASSDRDCAPKKARRSQSKD